MLKLPGGCVCVSPEFGVAASWERLGLPVRWGWQWELGEVGPDLGRSERHNLSQVLILDISFPLPLQPSIRFSTFPFLLPSLLSPPLLSLPPSPTPALFFLSPHPTHSRSGARVVSGWHAPAGSCSAQWVSRASRRSVDRAAPAPRGCRVPPAGVPGGRRPGPPTPVARPLPASTGAPAAPSRSRPSSAALARQAGPGRAARCPRRCPRYPWRCPRSRRSRRAREPPARPRAATRTATASATAPAAAGTEATAR